MTTPRARLTAFLMSSGLAAAALASAAGPAEASPAGGDHSPRAACSAAAPHAAVHTGKTANPSSAQAAGSPPAAVFRVDQIGYAPRAAKLAALMTHSAKPGARWELVSARPCRVVARGVATVSLGSWSHRYPAVWAIRFSGVQRPGVYRLALAAHPRTVSPWFRIAPAPRLYAGAVANALLFYQNERDGPDFIRSALRTAPGHRNDASAMTFRAPKVTPDGNFRGSLRKYATGVRINATGGWWDAGDYLKFTQTTSYTVAMLLQGIVSFPAQLGGGHRLGRTSFVAEAKFGVDFLQRMWNEQTKTLYFQVGTGEANNFYVGDHDIWRLPQADDHYHGTNPHDLYIRHPPVFRAGPPGAPISPNLAGRLAADFALCYRVFRTSDPGYANRCLRSAETVYALAGTHWKGHLLTVLPFDFYGETSWRDDMMLGATQLALALRSAGHASLPAGLPVRSARRYLMDAAGWAHQWMGSKSALADTLNLYDVSALADYELYRAIGRAHPRLPVTKAALLANLRGQIQRAVGIGKADPFRFGFAWDQWDTTAHGIGLSVMASEYDALTGRPVYAARGQRWLDDVLGTNAWGVSLIVGDGTIFPDCMQHQVTNLIGSHNGTPPVLAGAAVEGPNSFAATGVVANMRPCSANAPGNVPYSAFRGHKAVFRDNVQSYSTVEPAIDLTALSPMAFAWLQAGGQGRF
ncbi:MAG: glycoside hydrolase family 9 protein [Streptosporangiaceae bacterium]